ncbi:hypothetical protein lerEdw1_008630 [Lerista edwardsae]|nr:hypothetical protein lerEdw1_008630 [Lerista edwardsae]
MASFFPLILNCPIPSQAPLIMRRVSFLWTLIKRIERLFPADLVNRLFPADLFGRMASKAAKALNIQLPQETSARPSTSSLLPRGPTKPMVAPFPVEFREALEAEWKAPVSIKHVPRFVDKLYSLPEDALRLLQVPTVDAPVAALSSSAVLPPEGEGGPKDPCDKQVEAALKRNFQFTAGALRASSGNSPVADVFDSRNNAQVERFIARAPEEGASGIDTLQGLP